MHQPLRCTCGRRVRPQDILEGGIEMEGDHEGRVRVRYLCGSCESIASAEMSLAAWDEGRVLDADETEDDDDRAPGLGIITFSETRRFRDALNGTRDCMVSLRRAVEPRARRSSRRGDSPRGPRDS